MKAELKKAFKDYVRNYAPDSEQNTETMRVLESHNIIVGSERIEHDDLVRMLLAEAAKANKINAVNSFLIGIENGCPVNRAALAAYAITLNFPSHKFESVHGFSCDICGCSKINKVDFTLIDIFRHLNGATYDGGVDGLYLFLRELNKFSYEVPSSVGQLRKVLGIIRSAEITDTPVVLEKKIRGGLDISMSKEESRALLNLLGHIGVLESPEHKGFLNGYKNLGLMPRKSRSSDWSYPVDFWKGEYGVNEEAVEFWFGDYLRKFK